MNDLKAAAEIVNRVNRNESETHGLSIQYSTEGFKVSGIVRDIWCCGHGETASSALAEALANLSENLIKLFDRTDHE